MTLQHCVVEPRGIERARRSHSMRLIIERTTGIEQRFGDRPIDQAGVEMAQPEMRGEPLAERSFARRGRAIDRDDHARFE